MKRRVLLLSSVLVATGCSTGSVGQLPAQSGTNPATFGLGLAVGTARIATNSGGSVVGLNVVATFRQPGGQNATLANTPTLSGPATFGLNPDGTPSNALSGALPTDVLAAASSAGQAPPPGDLGSLIGVFGYGFAPLNIVAIAPNQAVYGSPKNPYTGCDGIFEPNTLISSSIRYEALSLPLDLNVTCNGTNQLVTPFAWYGGPPAWPSPQGYGMPGPDPTTGEYFRGYPLGFMDFDDVKPALGQYSLTVEYLNNPAGTQYSYAQATAALSNATALPVMPTPSLDGEQRRERYDRADGASRRRRDGRERCGRGVPRYGRSEVSEQRILGRYEANRCADADLNE